MNADEHPSYVALDSYVIDPTRRPEVGAHVAGCERCRRYVAHLSDRGVAPPLVRLLERRRARRRFLASGAASAGVVAAAAAVALAVVMGPRGSDGDAGATTTARGSPSVSIYVQRDTAAPFLWDGESALRPGDRLRLRVLPAGLRHVSVFEARGGTLATPFERTLGAEEHDVVLPRAWAVDEVDPGEALVVVVSDAAPTEGAVAARLAESPDGSTEDGLWVRRFELAGHGEREQGR